MGLVGSQRLLQLKGRSTVQRARVAMSVRLRIFIPARTSLLLRT